MLNNPKQSTLLVFNSEENMITTLNFSDNKPKKNGVTSLTFSFFKLTLLFDCIIYWIQIIIIRSYYLVTKYQ